MFTSKYQFYDFFFSSLFTFVTLFTFFQIQTVVSLSTFQDDTKTTSHLMSFLIQRLVIQLYNEQLNRFTACRVLLLFLLSWPITSSIWQSFNKVSPRHAPNWEMNFSSNYNQKSLKILTQVCENKFLYYK